jgi:hypothetical protein
MNRQEAEERARGSPTSRSPRPRTARLYRGSPNDVFARIARFEETGVFAAASNLRRRRTDHHGLNARLSLAMPRRQTRYRRLCGAIVRSRYARGPPWCAVSRPESDPLHEPVDLACLLLALLDLPLELFQRLSIVNARVLLLGTRDVRETRE